MFKWLFKKKGCAKHMNNKLEVIGIDHGWSMMKTISQVFVTGVKEITTTPALFGDVLEYEGKFYKVGTVRQEVKDTKVEDDSFYLLTLAAVAKELKRRGLAEAKVFLAVGLPLTRFGAEKNDFIKYLTKNKRVSFKYENESYHIEIDDVAVFPQCYAAVVDKIPTMAKKTLIVDIGSWTIDIMPVINKSPDESKCVTIPKGLITCMRSINAKLQKTSSNTSITDGNGNYSIAGATYGVFADKDCTKQLATLTTDENGNTDIAEVKADTVYIKELSAPAGYKVDKTVYSLKVEAGKTATLKVSDTPKVTDTLIELFKIDMETQKDNPQGNASLAGAEFTWKYYTGFYNKDNLPAEVTRTWVTKTIAETESDGTIHYVTKLADTYKVSGDSFYMQDGKAVLPLGTLTVEETKAPNGYLLDGAYMQAGDKSEQIKGLYLTQITEDGDLAVLTGSNQFSVSDKVIRGGVKIQKRDLETGDTKPQGSATLKDTAFDIISLNDNAVLVEGKLYKKNEVVKIIRTDIEGIASTSADLLPYGKFRMNNEKSRNAGTGIFRSLFFLRP